MLNMYIKYYIYIEVFKICMCLIIIRNIFRSIIAQLTFKRKTKKKTIMPFQTLYTQYYKALNLITSSSIENKLKN